MKAGNGKRGSGGGTTSGKVPSRSFPYGAGAPLMVKLGFELSSALTPYTSIVLPIKVSTSLSINANL